MKSARCGSTASRVRDRSHGRTVRTRIIHWATLLFLGLLASAVPALADGCIPYCNVGTIAPTNIFNAVDTGQVTGYFVGKGPAGDTDFVRMLDLTTNTTGDWIFNNQTSQVGDMAAFGVANAGDLLVFEIWNQTLNSIFASEPDLSADGQNHAYATQFSGGIINGFDFPAGTYVGMEDLPDGQSDWNYQDDQFVATNVAIVPEPGSLLVLGSGILTVAGFTRRRLF
jgi:PEP-CTERM motif